MNRVEAFNRRSRDAAPVRGSYICDDFFAHDCPDRPTSRGPAGDHCWHESTARRLEWQGGPSQGAEADIAAWNRLGQSRAVAA